MVRVAMLWWLIWPAISWSIETIWLEAEHFEGIRGYCWPGGRPELQKTDGHWGLSGPGWAAEWIQGGESGFLSIACAPEDDRAIATTEVEIPIAGRYRVWVRFRENRNSTNRFQVRLRPRGAAEQILTYGERPMLDEDNEIKLYFDWVFVWQAHEVELPSGRTRITLASAFKEKGCRQIDCLVLTTDTEYRPFMKERPRHPTRQVLEEMRWNRGISYQPLARRPPQLTPPAAWQPKTFRDQGFLYLWNMSPQIPWASDDPKRVLVPYHVADDETRQAFEKMYAGRADVPIFGDPRIVPVFHGSGPSIFDTESSDGKPLSRGRDFMRWLDANPKRCFALLLNYYPDQPIREETKNHFLRYRDRYVGAIAGESLGYFDVPVQTMMQATAGAKSRRELADAIGRVALAANAEKYRRIYGGEWPDSYREVIPCQSIMMTAFAPLCYAWGARTVGYESSAITGGLLALRMAFLRGAARQNGGLTATYRSCNFGDSSTIFSDRQSYTRPRNILDNYYSVFSGAGMTWYKFDIWHQYLAGSSMFYHEQGFDEFWMPGGTTVAGLHPVQLSPKGKLVDRFLRKITHHPDRGVPWTPIAFLVDYAHGWDPSPFTPHSFDNYGKRPDLTRYGSHERMLQEYFWVAYHPIGQKAEGPVTGTSEVNVPGIFGNIFDVVYAYPDVRKWTTLDSYPVVVVAGDIELTVDEGRRLAKYIEEGGTLVIADEHLSGPGLEELARPTMRAGKEASGCRWVPTGKELDTQRFRYRPIEGGQPLAVTQEGDCFCCSFDRGRGRLIILSVPRGLGIDQAAHPVVPLLFAHLTSGLVPVSVQGDVEWMLNRTSTGWIVALFNPAGQDKPQQGILPTDYRQNRSVVIKSNRPILSVRDWLYPFENLSWEQGQLKVEVWAGSVRVVELTEK